MKLPHFTNLILKPSLILFCSVLWLSACSDQPMDPKEEAATDAMDGKTEMQLDQATTPQAAKEANLEAQNSSNDAMVSESPAVENAPDASADDTTHYVKATVTKFVPMVVFAKPGDKIVWTNMAGHDSASLNGMIPKGAKVWRSELGKQFSVTVDQEGAYIYKCTPHASMGMLGAIVVGDEWPNNLEVIEGHTTNKGMVTRTIRKLKKALESR